MAWSQSDLDAIDAAIKSGELRVQFADRSITYRSLDEMLRIKGLIAAELATTGSPMRRQLRVWTSKGT